LEVVRGVRANGEERERSVKTGRGWWVVWMRVAAAESRRGSFAAAAHAGQGTAIESDAGEKEDASSTRALREITPEESETVYKEAILVRRARDAAASRPSGKRIGSGFFGFGGLSSSGKDVGSGWGPAWLAEGVGVDARRYVEGLLSLSR
jgi:hypothetical protein